MLEITSIDIDPLTAISDQVYKVSDPALSLPVPQFIPTPALATTAYTYSVITPTPAFVTIIGGTDESSQIQIVSSSEADTGIHTVTIQTYEEYSQITKTSSFQLTVSCIQQLITATFIPNKTYYIGDPQISFAVPTFTLLPSACPSEINYSVLQGDGSALPASISLDASVPGSENIKVVETDVNAATVFTIAVKAIDQKTGIESDTSTFTVTIRLRATGLNIVPGTEISDQNYLVGTSARVISVADYTIFPSNANVDLKHTLDASTPSFINLVEDPTGDTITILTSSAADTGVYTILLTYTDLFEGISTTDTFVVTVSCVQTITQPNSFAPVEYYITDPITPVILPLYTISPSDCPYELFI